MEASREMANFSARSLQVIHLDLSLLCERLNEHHGPTGPLGTSRNRNGIIPGMLRSRTQASLDRKTGGLLADGPSGTVTDTKSEKDAVCALPHVSNGVFLEARNLSRSIAIDFNKGKRFDLEALSSLPTEKTASQGLF